MGFRDLYDFAQTLSPKVSRKHIKVKALEVCGIARISHAKTEMDLSICRGIYMTPQNSNHRISQQLGTHVIVTARDLNYCWERFVYVKELMHLFGSAAEASDTGEKFENLLNEFSASGEETSAQMQSEYDSFWMALAVLCPDHRRTELKAAKLAQETDDYAIALELKIPQQYVPRLFEPRYERILSKLIS